MKGSGRRQWRGMEMENQGGGRRGGMGEGNGGDGGKEGWRERENVRWLKRMDVGIEGDK